MINFYTFVFNSIFETAPFFEIQRRRTGPGPVDRRACPPLYVNVDFSTDPTLSSPPRLASPLITCLVGAQHSQIQ